MSYRTKCRFGILDGDEIVLTEADGTDVCPILGDLQSVDNIVHEIKDELPVVDAGWIRISDAARTVDEEGDVEQAICRSTHSTGDSCSLITRHH